MSSVLVEINPNGLEKKEFSLIMNASDISHQIMQIVHHPTLI